MTLGGKSKLTVKKSALPNVPKSAQEAFFYGKLPYQEIEGYKFVSADLESLGSLVSYVKTHQLI